MQVLPIQREFLAADAISYNHNSQAVLLTAPAGIDLPLVVEELYRRHDALRLRFVFAGGIWQAEEAPLTASMISESCVFETLPEDSNLQSKFIREQCAHYLHGLDITHGPLFRAVYLQGHAEKQGRLFLVIHHLVVDEISWRVLLRDLDAAYRQVSSSQRTTKASSYQQWAEALTGYATSDALQLERDYWRDNCTQKLEPWPVPPLSKKPACYASVRSVPVQLSVADTAVLLKDCTATYHTEINELLLCAVYQAMRQWSGQSRVRITLEEHGRENLFPEIDITETVGCFTTRYPLVLHSEARELSAVVKSVKEQYRAVPHRGIGYGLLRYVAGDEVLAAADAPALLFRYQGELNQVMHSVDPHRLREHALSLSGSVAGKVLRFKLEYSERQYSEVTMMELAGCLEQALRMLIAHSQEAGAGYYTPSDFPLATVHQTTLDEWQRTYDIDQLYLTTPMQRGMFFHTLLDPSVYVTQLYSMIEGDLQLPLLQQAWETVIERHAVLRTVFVGEGEQQHQLVIKRVSLPWYEEDLRGLTAEAQSARFEEYRQADRARGFGPTDAPLMRLSLFRLNDDQYRLLWSHHHTLLDGWSISLVYGEVMQVYAALNEGLRPPLPPVAEYARYIEWLLAQDSEKARQYWQTYLADVDTVTRLPYDTQVRQQQPIHQMQEVSLSAADTAQLSALAKTYHTTVNTLLQLAWGIVLQRYSNEKTVVFGSVISGRLADVPEIERIVGLCINSIPVVLSFDRNESLAEAITRLHSTFQQSQGYGYLPFMEIKKQSRLSGVTPLFESLLSFERYALDLTMAAPDRAGSVRMGEFGANLHDTFPLTLSLWQRESLQVTCKYFADRFNATTVSRMLDHFIRVLQQLPNCLAVTDIRLLLSETERQQLQEWNETAVAYPREQLMYELFTEQAASTPAAVAVEYEGARLSYGELNRRANQLAHYLRRLGVGPESRVGLCMERSLEMVVGLLAILKAGGAYVPLDREYPLERLRFMIADAQLRVVLTNDQALAAFAAEAGVHLIDLNVEAEQISRESAAEPESGVTADNLAYVIYTSGSTGIPKGVAIAHRNVSAFLHWAIEFFSAARLQAVLASTSINFDLSIFELFAPLSVGGRVILAENALQLPALAAAAQVELVNTVPSAMAELIRQRAVPASVRVVNLAGEALSRKLVQEIYALGTVEQVINLYGPSEDTTYSTCEVVADAADDVVLIGRPISNSQIYLLDEAMQLVAIGVPGELYIAGDGLARGYLGRAELTAERFVPHPFARAAGERLYRTGDLGRYREDGRIEYLGRVDQQVKIRGFRIELGEIEAQLGRHPQVQACVLTANEAEVGGKRLVAYVVAAETVTASELRRYLQEKLPGYMVPQVIVKLEQLPLTPNGKVDRKALPAPDTGEEGEVGYVGPQTPEEELLAGIWAAVLGVERVSVHDNFFERGGHSLLATQVVSRIRAVFGIDLPLWVMFETATVAELAQLIVAERQVEAGGTVRAIERRSRDGAPVLSYAQQRLWFLHQFEPESSVYNVPAAMYLRGELDHAALAQSLSEIVRRHEVLRTSFPSVGGQPVQHIAPAAPINLPLTDLQALTEQDREILEARYSTTKKVPKHEFTFSGFTNSGHCADASAKQLAAEEAALPFDLEHGPVWRVKLLRVAEQEHVLLLTMHHIVTDGWSVGVLIRELTGLYEAYSRGAASPLAELPIQYADYAEWQREWLQGAVLEEQMGYWREQLAGSSGVLELPVDHARPPVQSHRGASLTVQLSEELTHGLRELSQREGVTLFMTLLSGWQTLLARYSGQWDLNVGTPIANRTRGEVEDLIGFFVNTLVLRTRMNGTASFREQLQQVREVCLGAYAHQDVPFEMVVEELQPERDVSRSPLFQVMFVLLNAPLGEFETPAGLKLEPLAVDLETTKFDLMLALMETETGLVAWCNYRTELFEETTIARMLEHWQVLLEAAVADPEQSLSALPLLPEAEREQLLAWNETATVYPREHTIHDLLAEQAASTPAAVAVEYEDMRLSYDELNRRANQLAHYLRRRGVGPDVRVGLCVDRSLEMVVGLLGILKAGGAYVPLDRDYPLERLNFMIADAQLNVLVTEEKSLDALPAFWGQVISLDGEASEIGAESEADVASGVTADNLAYVIYTSGSTGTPKGVEVPHRAVVRLLLNTNYVSLNSETTVLQLAPLSFDASTFEVWAPLLHGGRLLVMKPGLVTAKELGATIREHDVKMMWLTASLFNAVVDESCEELRGLQQLLVGGEALSAKHIAQAQQVLNGTRLINGYGPTEATTFTCCHEIGPVRNGATVPIGRPIANTEAYVLDASLDLVPAGVNGELYIGGDGLARGYLNRAELTAERFVPHPYARRVGERLYRTGDVVRHLPTGEIEFIGRRDAQVKVRGFRIELGEIETVLGQHGQVRAAVAVVREAKSGDKQLLAYVVGEAAVGELQRYLKEKLPQYMVPQLIVKLESLPLTANGKVDRHALPAPEQTGEETAVEYVAPRTAEEELLAGIWAEVLGVERVSVHDNFFERGGHSLLATQVVSRIRALFRIELPLRALFDAATLAELAQRIVAERQLDGLGTGPAIERRSRDTAPVLSYAQQRLWFLDQLEPQSAIYNVSAAIQLKGGLDSAALAQSLSEIARRHEVLRTSFPSGDGQPVQLIAPRATVDLPLIDLQDEENKAAVVRQLAAEEAARPFDLAHGPVWRVKLLQLGEQEHVLLLTMHHIVTDGWSVGVLIRELTGLYEAYSRGAASPLAELPIQYADYAEWQREWLQGTVLEEQMGYWREQLAGSSGVLELPMPTDHARPPVQSYRGAMRMVQLSDELTHGLRELSQREGVTLFMTLLSGWQTLLARYSGQWDLNVGTPIANRTRGEVEDLIGFFVNTLVLRTRMNASGSFREQLQQVREVCLGAYAHQDVPFEMVVEELQPQRDISRSPLFQVMFVLQNAPLGEFELPAGLKLEPQEVELETTKFDLTLTMMETEAGLVGWCNYRTELFEETTIARMLEHWQVLLEAAVADPEQSLSALPLLPEAEREQVLVTWNETSAEYPRETCIHELFEQQVERTPAATAVIFGGEQLSYRELNARANQLAHYLRERGVSVGEPVGLCVERSPEMVVGMLGVLKAGGGYVPIDPEYPRERLSQMLTDSGIKLLLTQQHLEGQLPEHGAQVVRLDGDWDEIAQSPATNLRDVATAENLAYMIYTSGSTGQPKGVMVPHRALGNHMAWMQRRFPLTTADRVIQKTPFSFDASVWELFAPLLVGARLVIAASGGHQDLAYLVRFIKEQQITALKIVPSLLEPLLEESGIEECVSLRYVFCGAEAMPVKLAEKFVQRLDAELFNLYGPTETAIDVTYWKCETATGRRSIPIGRPIINTQAYVLDEAMRAVPAGVAGELYVGGESLAHGYWQRAELTAERFVPNPFSETAGARLYRTGDVVRWNKAGELEYLGRVDNQVKVRGYRIELGEIETVLGQHGQVRAAVAVVREAKSGDKQLLAYVVGEAAVTELQRYLKEKLPQYMVPQLIVKLESLPLTANGKVDRHALPAPEQTGEETAVEYVAPRTAEEELLAGIWAEVLGVERVSVHDNFFERGGHSLLATQVVSRIRALFRVDLPLRAMFDTATLAGLAQRIVAERQVEGLGTGRAIERRSRETAPVLSYAQQRLWFLDQLEPQSALYNVPAAIQLKGELDRAALAHTLTEIARRHEVLRTSFPSGDGQPVQLIAPRATVDLPLIDLQDEENKAAVVRQLAAEEAARPFDLAYGPVWRVKLLQLGEQEHVLLLTMHHIVTDGWSVGVLIRELTVLYEAYSRQQASPLAELPIQYADYAEWQREWLQGAVLEEQMGYWREQLTGSSGVLELPVDHARPPVQSYRGAMRMVQLSEELTHGLRELSQREGVTLFMTLLSGWQTLLARYSGQWDLNVGTPIANRTRGEVEELIGFFVNTLVLRTRMQAEASFREQLQQVREVCLGAYAHQDVPFEMVVEQLQPERDVSRSPLFQVMFVLQNAPLGEFEMPAGLKLEPQEVELETTKFDLTLTMMETETGLVAWCNYRTELFEETTIARMLEHWQVLLEAAVADPEQSLSALPLLPEAEREQVLEWNNTYVVYAQAEKCLHEIIEAQVEKTPDQIALVSREASWTYAELNERANRLAHYLQRQGAGPESLVGIMMERSAAMVVALLGILKAGAAYLPLDPDYPGDRLSFMLADAGVSVLVSEQHLAARLPETSAQLVLVDADEHAIEQQSGANPLSGIHADNLAYVLYTSGSTGKPKGAMLAHREVVNCVLWMQQVYELDERDRMLCKTTLNFDPSVWEIFWPLMVGSRIVVTTPEAQLDTAALLQTIIDEKVTVAYFVPSMLAHFLSEAAVGDATTLRQVICGGESLDIEWVKRFYELLPQATLHHSYGPTETAIAAAEIICDRDCPHSVMPIGRPPANVKLHVLDEQMRPVPVGVLGELFVGGAGLGRGYLNRADLTAERFIPDPFSEAPGARLYRTGDLVRYLADGNLQFHGRADTQVKVRGVRIELGEIEAAIMSHEKVSSVAVVAHADRAGEKSLVGYVVAARETNLTATELRQSLSQKLPVYMVPAAFVFMSELPLLPNGKLDRSSLPVPQTAEPADGYVGPRNPVEELIAGVWADVLGIKAVSINSDFFAAGGHSLLATQVIARLRQIFHVDVPLRSLFEKPTIAGLSEKVSAAMNDGLFIRAHDIDAIARASRDGELPLSFAQERLWFWEQLQPGTATYNITAAFRLDGDLDVSILEQSLNEIMRRHEILRTSYAAVEGHPVQVVAPHSFVPLHVMDLSYLPESERDFAVHRLAGEEGLRPFDLTQSPLLRVRLLRLSAREHVALVSMHHIVSDAWSMGVLVEEMATLYQEFMSGNPSPLPELPVQYADFAKWQREWLQGDVLTEQLAYWKEQLRDAPLLRLRTDRPRPQVYSSKGSIVPVTLPAELLHELKTLSRQNNVTLFMTLLAAFNVLLHRHTGQDDIVVGTDIANRTRVETEKLIGFFVNMLVLRTNLQGDPNFTELLRRVREVTLGAYTYQDVPFAKLVDEFHLRRELTRNPLFQVVFVLQNAPVKNLELSGLTLSPVEFEVKSAPFDLAFVLSETADTLTGAVTYSTELFDQQTVQQLVRHYQNVLEGVVADPDQALSSLAILQDHEIDSHAVSNFEVKLSRKDLEDVLFELSQASHSQ